MLNVSLVAFLIITVATSKKVPSACFREGEIALSFDQGPSYYTGILLNILKKENVKAAFHVTPDYLDNPVIMAYLRRASQDSHIVGLYVKQEIMDNESEAITYIKKMSGKLQPHIGQKIRFLRFAHPGPSASLLEKVIAAGYIVTGYNLDSNDFIHKETTKTLAVEKVFETLQSMLDSIVAPARGSFVVVQRDLLDFSVTATEKFIKYAKNKSYTFARIDQCISATNINSSGKISKINEQTDVSKTQNSAIKTSLSYLAFVSIFIIFLQ